MAASWLIVGHQSALRPGYALGAIVGPVVGAQIGSPRCYACGAAEAVPAHCEGK